MRLQERWNFLCDKVRGQKHIWSKEYREEIIRSWFNDQIVHEEDLANTWEFGVALLFKKLNHRLFQRLFINHEFLEAEDFVDRYNLDMAYVNYHMLSTKYDKTRRIFNQLVRGFFGAIIVIILLYIAFFVTALFSNTKTDDSVHISYTLSPSSASLKNIYLSVYTLSGATFEQTYLIKFATEDNIIKPHRRQSHEIVDLSVGQVVFSSLSLNEYQHTYHLSVGPSKAIVVVPYQSYLSDDIEIDILDQFSNVCNYFNPLNPWQSPVVTCRTPQSSSISEFFIRVKHKNLSLDQSSYAFGVYKIPIIKENNFELSNSQEAHLGDYIPATLKPGQQRWYHILAPPSTSLVITLEALQAPKINASMTLYQITDKGLQALALGDTVAPTLTPRFFRQVLLGTPKGREILLSSFLSLFHIRIHGSATNSFSNTIFFLLLISEYFILFALLLYQVLFHDKYPASRAVLLFLRILRSLDNKTALETENNKFHLRALIEGVSTEIKKSQNFRQSH